MRMVSLSVLCLALTPALGACSIALDGGNGAFSAAPGKYDFICSFAGHFAAGMKGTLVVGK